MKDFNLKNKKTLEWIALCLFFCASITISFFHEPWFDEAQVWQIAKCANLRELLFEIPHYEGHPALWSLILAVPAKLGVPFELGLKGIGVGLSLSCVYLILFKMPFPRFMRILLPFTYFVFYQFSIIVRPYMLMMLSLLLLALCFPNRYIHPWKYCGLLILLCLSSAYGIVIAGGIALCMVFELLEEKGMRLFFSEIFKDQRTRALCVLLLAAMIVILEILPRKDTWVTSAARTNSFIKCLCCSLFTFLGEATLTTSSWFRKDRVLLQNAPINDAELYAFCIIGIVLLTIIICTSSKKLLKYFLVPYTLLSVFAASVYFSVHHVGIYYLLLLFWLGILFQNKNRFEIGRLLIGKISSTENDRRLMRLSAIGICFIIIAVQFYWNISASVNDIKYEFSYGRSGSAFIREHGLENAKILSSWGDSQTEILGDNETRYQNIYEVGLPVLLNAYFDHNICMNLNDGNDDEAYLHYKIPTISEIENAIQSWRTNGIPDVLIGKPNLEHIYGNEIDDQDYTLVHTFHIHYIWKNSITGGYFPMFARADIMDEYHLEPYSNEGFKYLAEGLQITDEMKEQFEKGVPVEEILKPYLDAMFGEE